MLIRSLAAALAVLSLAACGQNAQNAQSTQSAQMEAGGLANPSLSPEMRARLQKIRLDAKTASLDALSVDHRKAAIAAANDFNAGSLSFPEAANKIDAVLTPSETDAVLAQQRKMRSEMRQAFAASGQASASGRRFAGGRAGARSPDAGRFLVQVLASPDKLRAAMRRFSPQSPAP